MFFFYLVEILILVRLVEKHRLTDDKESWGCLGWRVAWLRCSARLCRWRKDELRQESET